jgi:ATP-binding cassette subfamily B protein
MGEAVAAIGVRAGLARIDATTPAAPTELSERRFDAWIAAAADWLGFDAEQTSIPYSSLGRRLAQAAPALVRIPGTVAAPRFLALVSGGRRHIRVLTMDSGIRRCDQAEVAAFLTGDRRGSAGAAVETLLSRLGVDAAQSERMQRAIVNEQLRSTDLDGVWLMRPHPSTSFASEIHRAGLRGRVALLAAAHLAQYVCLILAWWAIGLASLQGRLDRGWLWAWALLSSTMVPLTVLTTWLQGTIAIAAGGILKQRLLEGALRLDADRIRHEGAGHLLGRTLESEAVAALGLGGGFLVLLSVVELMVALAVLACGAAPIVEVVLLLVWTAVIGILAWRSIEANGAWAEARLLLTHELVERMIGHRTRLAQETPERWHRGEDERVDRYIDASRTLDRRNAALVAAAARGWLFIAIAGLSVALVGLAAPARLATSIGGALLAFQAFRRLAIGTAPLAEAVTSWRQVAPLFDAGGHRDSPGVPDLAVGAAAAPAEGESVVEAHDLSFRFPSRATPVLDAVSFTIRRGDRVMLEGTSGSGKSTLASVLVAMRRPRTGLLLAGGLDRHSVGSEGWRRRIASAPQFHENHIISGTFGFNLLMSRQWPPTEQDIELLEPLCEELGLGGLLRRMPGGLMQLVGESGWQLSHGERSRVFLARAILQGADLVILDETFAALDPESLRQSMACAIRHAPAMLVIGHG